MVVGTLEIHLRLDGCRSLKEKRRTLTPVIERLRRDLRASVAEVGDNDLWNVAVVGFACVGSSALHVQQTLDVAVRIVDECADIDIDSVCREVG
jgi:uncharacterized protein YlxP (DUF503 family)